MLHSMVQRKTGLCRIMFSKTRREKYVAIFVLQKCALLDDMMMFGKHVQALPRHDMCTVQNLARLESLIERYEKLHLASGITRTKPPI